MRNDNHAQPLQPWHAPKLKRIAANLAENGGGAKGDGVGVGKS